MEELRRQAADGETTQRLAIAGSCSYLGVAGPWEVVSPEPEAGAAQKKLGSWREGFLEGGRAREKAKPLPEVPQEAEEEEEKYPDFSPAF